MIQFSRKILDVELGSNRQMLYMNRGVEPIRTCHPRAVASVRAELQKNGSFTIRSYSGAMRQWLVDHFNPGFLDPWAWAPVLVIFILSLVFPSKGGGSSSGDAGDSGGGDGGGCGGGD